VTKDKNKFEDYLKTFGGEIKGEKGFLFQ